MTARPWDYVEPESLQREESRIHFRQALMSVPGGLAWLLHVCRLYGQRESLIAPDHIGLPDAIRIAMFEREEVEP